VTAHEVIERLAAAAGRSVDERAVGIQYGLASGISPFR
jgi:hypothetical protein